MCDKCVSGDLRQPVLKTLSRTCTRMMNKNDPQQIIFNYDDYDISQTKNLNQISLLQN